MPPLKLVPALAAAALALALAGCSAPATTGSGGDASAAPASTSAAPAEDTASAAPADAAGGDLCALVPSAELTAAVGTDAGAGVSGSANGLSNCTWTVGDVTVLAQSAEAVTYFPTDLYPKPEGASDLEGVDSGWASADLRTVFIVKNGQGFMLNDFLFGVAPGGQDAWTALGNAIAANM